jgi:hypothetical protein
MIHAEEDLTQALHFGAAWSQRILRKRHCWHVGICCGSSLIPTVAPGGLLSFACCGLLVVAVAPEGRTSRQLKRGGQPKTLLGTQRCLAIVRIREHVFNSLTILAVLKTLCKFS